MQFIPGQVCHVSLCRVDRYKLKENGLSMYLQRYLCTVLKHYMHRWSGAGLYVGSPNCPTWDNHRCNFHMSSISFYFDASVTLALSISHVPRHRSQPGQQVTNRTAILNRSFARRIPDPVGLPVHRLDLTGPWSCTPEVTTSATWWWPCQPIRDSPPNLGQPGSVLLMCETRHRLNISSLSHILICK